MSSAASNVVNVGGESVTLLALQILAENDALHSNLSFLYDFSGIPMELHDSYLPDLLKKVKGMVNAVVLHLRDIENLLSDGNSLQGIPLAIDQNDFDSSVQKTGDKAQAEIVYVTHEYCFLEMLVPKVSILLSLVKLMYSFTSNDQADWEDIERMFLDLKSGWESRMALLKAREANIWR